MDNNKDKFTMSVPKERYEQQLDDTRWRLKAENIRIRDKHKCRLCGAKTTQLDVHHIRYVYGREAWDYDDSDLVTLCHKCHEELHVCQDFEKLAPGGYFYHKLLNGVGIIKHKYPDGIWFNACWTDEDKAIDGHGRLYIEDFSCREYVRMAKPSEVIEFWNNVEKYYNIESIISYFGDYLGSLLPIDHPIRINARNCFKECIKKVENQKIQIREKFNFFLLVSNEYFALFEDNRLLGSPCKWAASELPCAYFLIAPVNDVIQNPDEDNSRKVLFEELELSNFRAATQEELDKWMEYTWHLDDLRIKNPNINLPF